MQTPKEKLDELGRRLEPFFKDPDRSLATEPETEKLIREYCDLYESIYIFPEVNHEKGHGQNA